MKIIALSKANVSRFKPDEPWACILISTFGDYPEVGTENVLKLQFADINKIIQFGVPKEFIEKEGYILFSEDHAKQILEFVDKHIHIPLLVVACEMGISRSPAIVAALMAEKCPTPGNKFVYKIMYKVIGDAEYS